ncbi:hypothetical protein AB0465_30590 [Streptomyces griseoviridis]
MLRLWGTVEAAAGGSLRVWGTAELAGLLVGPADGGSAHAGRLYSEPGWE